MKACVLAGILLLCGSVWAAKAVPAAAAIWIDVPFVQQTTDGCGSASLSMVMRYWDRKEGRAIAADAEETHIQAALFSRAAKGIFASSMRDYLQRAGY
ncbi:MAG TPA: C39 family peptidase, partial [Acidobacteriaceae bacterium]|nr:C39 family peptidase [Acidobacteriaceae bacterium]